MAGVTAGQPAPPGVNSTLQVRIKTIRSLFQALGAVVCLLFAAQGIANFINTAAVGDFWQACHWVADGVLYVLIGLGGCLLEFRGLFASVRQHFVSFAVNRLALALVYIWIGGYSMRSQTEEAWDTLGKVTGILAWFVGVVDILMACCSDRLERVQDDPKKARHLAEEDGGASGDDREPPSRYGNPMEAPASDRSSPAAEAESEAVNPFGDAPAEGGGGWATVGNKPFGVG